VLNTFEPALQNLQQEAQQSTAAVLRRAEVMSNEH
jgi:hypothetical protein